MIKQYKKYSALIIIIFLMFLGFLYMLMNKTPKYEFVATPINENKSVIPKEIEMQEEENLPIEDNIYEEITIQKVPVYVCGEVIRPDVYYLDEGSIIKDAIVMAGGFTEEANQRAWNLAMEIQQGLKIDVPKVGEEIDKILNSYDNSIEGINETKKLINMNTATVNELMSLPGIGPVIAQNIIQYRETNGVFRSLQDVNNVPRIGVVTLEKIKDYICFQ